MTDIRRSSLVWAIDRATTPPKTRPAVVLDISGDQLVVCFGTSTQRPGNYEIDHNGRVGKYLGLSNPTFFGPKATAIHRERDVSRVCKGFAEPKIMDALEAVLST